MGECTLDEIIAAGCCGENCGCDGVRLRYRPELQRAGVGVLVEVQWPAAWPDSEWRLVEVFRSGSDWGCLPARLAENGFPKGTAFRLPEIPGRAWTRLS